jgi:NTE family protein
MTYRSAKALVIGCGGTLGFAWAAAVLDALRTDAGWEPSEADILVGTSAGAQAAAMVGAGIRPGAIVAALAAAADADPIVVGHVSHPAGRFPPIPFPALPGTGLVGAALRGEVDRLAGLAGVLPRGRADATSLRRLGDALAGEGSWVPHRGTWMVAVDPRGRRVAFGSPHAPGARLGEALAASWAVPGWFPPVSIGGVRYLDGGIVSPTSADLVLGHAIDEVVVVAPMSGSGGASARGLTRLERLLRTAMTRRLDDEVRQLRAAGVGVIRIEPGAEDLRAMGGNVMDHRRRERVLATALATAPRLVARAFDRKGAAA